MEIYGDSLQFQRIDFFFDYNRRHLSLPGNNISRNNATLVDNKSRFFFFRNDLERIDLPRKNLFFVDVVRVYQVLLPPVQAVQVGIPQGKRP